MTLRRGDPGGLDVASTTTLLLNGKFNDDNSLVGITNSAPAGRFNTRAYNTSVNNSFFGYFFTTGWQETIFGFAYYNPNTTFVNNIRICNCQDGATTQVDIRTDGSGHIFATRNGTAIGSASTQSMIVGWHYIEMKVFVAGGTSGSVVVQVKDPNGLVSTWLNVTGVNTQATANASANRFYCISRNSGGTQYWKDIYILDTGTGTDRTFLGDTTVKVLYPNNVDSTFNQWTPNTATPQQCVADGKSQTGTWPDGDTSIISDTTSGHISAFQLDTLLPSGAIAGVIHSSYARTTSTGSMNQVTVRNGVVIETGSSITLTTSYVFYLDIMEVDPLTLTQWTAMGINSSHIGVKNTGSDARTSQELLLVLVSNINVEQTVQPHVWITA